MKIQYDSHLHSHFSADSSAEFNDMIQAGIQHGLINMCFTDHHDIDLPPSPIELPTPFLFDADSCLKELSDIRLKYPEMEIRFGVEIGLQPHVAAENNSYIHSYKFDFVIGSVHACKRKEPFYPEYFLGRTPQEALKEYLEETILNIQLFSDFDSLGHLDYMARYCKNPESATDFPEYPELLREVFKTLIEKGIALEVNTGGMRSPLKRTNPSAQALKVYREMGGELLTIGSDAHRPSDVAYGFSETTGMLSDCGFRYYHIYKDRTAVGIRL